MVPYSKYVNMAGATKKFHQIINFFVCLGLFRMRSEEFSEIVFEVGGQQFNSDETKKAKSSSTRFPAHRLILQKCSSSTLAELCQRGGGQDQSYQNP